MTKAKIKLLKSEEKGGKTVHSAVLSDGTEGYYDASKYPELIKGSEVEYSASKTNKGLTILDFTFIFGHYHEKNPVISAELIFQEKCKGAYKAMEITMDKLYQDQMDFDKINDWFKAVCQAIWDAIDECSQG